METQNPLLKDEDGEEVDVHMYRLMIGLLMYLTSSRPDIMFAVCACSRYQVNPKVSHLHDVKRIFRYLKGQPKLDLCYPKDSPFDLVAYTNSNYAGASLDMNSTTEGKAKKSVKLIMEKLFRMELELIDLQLEDAEGVDCLPNATIFEQLTLMGSKTTAWNEFSSTMASAIICLATNQKFNFLKYIFESIVKNLDNVGKFLMYLRFVQVFLDKQLEGMATHNGIYIAPSHTKKIFGNMRRVGKGFSRRETPLFQTMVVQDQVDMGEDNVADEAINEEMDDSLERPATTATSLDAEQDRGNINKTQSKATPNESSSLGTTSGGGPRCQETMRDTIAQTRFENVSKTSNDPLFARGNILRRGKDSLKLNELMELCTSLQQMVLDLETTKTTQANEIASLKRRVKKLERRNKSRTHGLKMLYRVSSSRRVESFEDEGLGEEDASKQERIADIDANEDITLVNDQDDADMFGVNDLDGDEVIVETAEEIRSVVEEVTAVSEKAKLGSAAATPVSTGSIIPVSAATTTTTTTTITEVEITLAQALAELKSAKPKADNSRPKAKGIVIHEQEQAPTPTVSLQQPSQVKDQDKGKGKMVEPEPVKKMSKNHIAWDDIQAKTDADYELAQRLQAQEQEELTDEEKARLFVQFLEQRRKHFAAKRAEEKRNRPPTRAQQWSIMCTYLKNIEGWKPKNLKNKSFANIQELFDKAMKRVNTFVDYRTELVEESSKKAEAEIVQESSSKRAGEELEQESSKKQKVEEDKESEELKQCLEIVLDDGDDVTIDATPLFIKSPTIVDYKIYQEGKKSFFQIIRADGKNQMYLTFGKMLKNFDREDLEVLWSIVKARFKKTEPVNYMDNLLFHHLKTMFEHHVKDNVWKKQQGSIKVLNWKLYDSCGVHCVTVQSMPFYLLVEKIYPLTKSTLHQLFNDVKLQVDYECEMAFELLRLVKK
ncbi:hypothetical protein Tco_0688258 [Tanacetum coccineum]